MSGAGIILLAALVGAVPRTKVPASAARTKASRAAVASVPADTAFRRTPYLGAIALDAQTGRVLSESRPHQPCYPASCTKLMTAYLALKAVRAGELRLDDRLVQSAVSYREKPSWIGIRPGESISVDDGFKALMVQSANDVAVMFAEKLGGTCEHFVELMNAEAQALGMTNTHFVTPNGYPPPRGSKRGFDVSTAADLGKLALVMVKEQPEILRYTALERVTIPEVLNREGEKLEMVNHNNLLVGNRRHGTAKFAGVDGLKTGYHDAGGSSLVVTATRNGKRAVVVVVGSSSAKARDDSAEQLLRDALGAIAW